MNGNAVRALKAAGVLALLAARPATAQEPSDPPSISVSAEGIVEVEPDRASLDIAVETQAETAREASQQNAERMARLNETLRGLGIPDGHIRTVSYQLHPVYARPAPDQRQEPRVVGYRALNMVRIVVDSIPRLGPIIDAAVEAGGNRVAGLSLELQDPSAAREEALRQATARARREAEVLASALGVGLGEPIRAVTSATPRPTMRMAAQGIAMEELAMARTTPVEGGTIEVRADVHLVYAIRPQ